MNGKQVDEDVRSMFNVAHACIDWRVSPSLVQGMLECPRDHARLVALRLESLLRQGYRMRFDQVTEKDDMPVLEH